MKVNERKGVLDPRVGSTGGVTPGNGSNPAPGAEGADQVSVSDAAREMARLKADVGNVDAVRSERVAGLRSATNEGRYALDVRGAARGLVREVLTDLLA